MTTSYASAVGALTPRMRDVLRCELAGSTPKQTAAELGISVRTVYQVRAALCARLGVSTMAAAGWMARGLGERL